MESLFVGWQGKNAKVVSKQEDAKIWYKCDPDKNTGCSKTFCMFTKVGFDCHCRLTSRKECAREGTLPQIIAVYKEGNTTKFIEEDYNGE